ncbi:hypothetical protein MHM99_10390 [Alteromonas sp. MmMcT2-2]|jgi:hypothetical protein|uniref:hypothetical protein n=1 Tax=Alteromonas sp. MmMcT2-2 TaxID=2917732 RepID=UPI001446E445|nr:MULTISPECIES: hypothetical protein [Alteromonas]MCG7641925.1 hypothetical protein [Alteromonas sp. MmMcT2-2]NKX32157.1 hypothetical protein [Alteromonadaceae bacterium A_SAG1]|tara:strand:+ start:492 stop:926 length:435 start_codon:yes stop_codon:yes gene_type:complete
MFQKFRIKAAINRLIEERLYGIVAGEIAKGDIRQGLWAKAFSQSSGDEQAAKSKYIELRVDSLRDESTLIHALIEEFEGNGNTVETEFEQTTEDIILQNPEPSEVEEKSAKDEYQNKLAEEREAHRKKLAFKLFQKEKRDRGTS